MGGRRRWLFAGLGLLAVAGVTLGTWLLLGRGEPDLEVRRPGAGEVEREPGGEADAEYVMVGGVRRKASDVRPAKRPAEPKEGAAEAKSPFDYGRTPRVSPDANPQVKSVAEAIREKKHPERVSVLIRPPPFDAKAFQADPAKYLGVVEPGRVFQTAQPGPKVPVLRPVGQSYREAVQGEVVPLRVKAPPGSPVTFTSFDLGAFENQLTSITVQADKQGVAEAKFRGTPGTIEEVHILAGSPEASGQVRFVVNVQRPPGAESPAGGAAEK